MIRKKDLCFSCFDSIMTRYKKTDVNKATSNPSPCYQPQGHEYVITDH